MGEATQGQARAGAQVFVKNVLVFLGISLG
jgi:hypothetical protein